MEARVVIAPDSFKGSATAIDAARAIAEGWRSERPDDEVRLLPMADGGEGTLDAFEAAHPHSRRMPLTVTGPDDRPVETSWLLLPDGTGVVELAGASGITLLDPLCPFDAHTLGFGQAIAAALDAGVERLVLGIGGSASTDGGAGALSALGARFFDESGSAISPGNRGLADLAEIDLGTVRALPRGGAVVLSDVTSTLLGTEGAAAVFGPQKGATVADIPLLEANLARLARILASGFETVAGAGAAGGAGYGLLSWGASLVAGAEAIGSALGAPAAIAAADVVITGEGRFDSQSAVGKVPSWLAGQARASGVTAMLVAGAIEAEPTQFAVALSLTELAGSSTDARANALHWLRAAGGRLARAYSQSRSGSGHHSHSSPRP